MSHTSVAGRQLCVPRVQCRRLQDRQGHRKDRPHLRSRFAGVERWYACLHWIVCWILSSDMDVTVSADGKWVVPTAPFVCYEGATGKKVWEFYQQDVRSSYQCCATHPSRSSLS